MAFNIKKPSQGTFFTLGLQTRTSASEFTSSSEKTSRFSNCVHEEREQREKGRERWEINKLGEWEWAKNKCLNVLWTMKSHGLATWKLVTSLLQLKVVEVQKNKLEVAIKWTKEFQQAICFWIHNYQITFNSLIRSLFIWYKIWLGWLELNKENDDEQQATYSTKYFATKSDIPSKESVNHL